MFIAEICSKNDVDWNVVLYVVLSTCENVLASQDFYEELEDEDFEIVFVSFDRSKEDLASYLAEAHGDWYHIPYGDPQIQ